MLTCLLFLTLSENQITRPNNIQLALLFILFSICETDLNSIFAVVDVM